MMTESEQIKADVNLRRWYHKIPITLPSGERFFTSGWAPISVESYRVETKYITGARVLDLGSFDGFWAFRAWDMGASSVTAIDDFSDEVSLCDKFARDSKWSNFDLIRSLKQYSGSNITRAEMSVYDISRATKPAGFNAIFAFGLLYHLKHPTYALERLLSVAEPDCRIFVESAILDDINSPYTKKKHNKDGVYCELYPGAEYGNNPSNFSVPTLKGLAAWLEISGWEVEETWKLTENPKSLAECRGFAKAIARGK